MKPYVFTLGIRGRWYITFTLESPTSLADAAMCKREFERRLEP